MAFIVCIDNDPQNVSYYHNKQTKSSTDRKCYNPFYMIPHHPTPKQNVSSAASTPR